MIGLLALLLGLHVFVRAYIVRHIDIQKAFPHCIEYMASVAFNCL